MPNDFRSEQGSSSAGPFGDFDPTADAVLQPEVPLPLLPSLRANSIARLASDLLAIVFALVAATITARILGPAEKGYYSSLVLLAGLFVQVFSAGLGEAAIVLSGRGKATLQGAASATALAMLPLTIAAAGTFLVTATAALPAAGKAGAAPLFASILVGVTVLYTTSASFLVAREQVVAVAGLAVLSNGLATALLVLLLAAMDLGTPGALLAGVIGSGVSLAITLHLLHRAGIALRPKRVPGYLGAAARFGAALQFSNLLVLLTARLDLVLVYRLSTPAEAGSYSIALTIGTMVGAVPMALSYASFPRLAVLDDADARDLTARVFRVGMVAALLGGAALAVATPFALPQTFGPAYRDAIAPTLLLLPGGLLWSAQWLLCRAAAARGRPAALLVSFALSFVTMVLLDFVLIPPLGGIGAGIASLVAPCLGLGVAAHFYRSVGADWRTFVPRWSDLGALAHAVRAMLLAGRARAGRS